MLSAPRDIRLGRKCPGPYRTKEMLVIKEKSTRDLAPWNGVSVNGLELANACERGKPNSRVAVHHKSGISTQRLQRDLS
jgi:hypothetical protein